MPSASLNLSAIDEAFGEKADLYRDVLGVKSDVTTEQIQQAYFYRRDELFKIFAQMDESRVPSDSPKRYQVERQMDAVVMCLRVLGDPASRLRYDAIRRDRVVGRKITAFYSQSLSQSADEDIPLSATSTSISHSDRSHPSNSYSPRRRLLKSALKKTKSTEDQFERSVTISYSNSVEYIDSPANNDEDDYDEDDYVRDVPPLAAAPSKDTHVSKSSRGSRKTTKSKSSSHRSGGSKGSKESKESKGGHRNTGGGTRVSTKRKTRKVTRVREESTDSKVLTDVDDEDDVSIDSRATTLSVIESRRSIFEVVKDEIVGVLEDTSRSVEQVFNAFTLQDDEIQAVFGRIDKAKKHLADEFTVV